MSRVTILLIVPKNMHEDPLSEGVSEKKTKLSLEKTLQVNFKKCYFAP